MVEVIKIRCCYKPCGFERIINYSLHNVSGASEYGYGQATYLSMVNDLEAVHCSLIFGKSRVAPIKYASIPRLELIALTRVNGIKNLKDVERRTGDPHQF